MGKALASPYLKKGKAVMKWIYRKFLQWLFGDTDNEEGEYASPSRR